MFAAFQVGPFQPNYQQGGIAAPPAVIGGNGIGRGRKGKQLFFVEVDGEKFQVSSEKEALDVLDQAAQLAVNSAPTVAAKAVVDKATTAPKPSIVVSPSLLPAIKPQLQEARNTANDAYAQAFAEAHAAATQARAIQAAQDQRDTQDALQAVHEHHMQIVTDLLAQLKKGRRG